MNRRIAPPQPFAPVDSTETAKALARGSAWAFWIWAGIGLMQAGLVWFHGDAAHQETRGATTGFMIVFAGFAILLGWMQWRRPNRILPGFGLAWALYELSALSVGLLVGAPLAAPGLPDWSIALAGAAMVLCLLLHIGGLRGAAALAQSAPTRPAGKP
ncbi:hypothetical protein D8I30_00330 [Brevundimonas naejangsanensis]|uniref:Uncharacterized protein n=1 Tax=Brevundimonas naejangsanensis TaxID=588932 RepID=A0A494RBW5_9CAUL|nr:hypothetical protein [Brevundimonas naejangsanensis]AYG93795.1 hypothetical protein D8I30_00330 [Brevundimonas naejangsanensis]